MASPYRKIQKHCRDIIWLILVATPLPAVCQVALPSVQALGTLGSLSSGANLSTSQQGLSNDSPLMAVPEDFAKLKIAPGFLLTLNIFDAPELSGSFRVDDGGRISLPLAGIISVSGLTTTEAQQLIQDKFIEGRILKRPQVIVRIEQYAPFIVTVLGQVQKPGRIQLLAPHSLLDVISQVGGETELAGNTIEIRHRVNGVELTEKLHYAKNSIGDSIKDVMIERGDTVIVPRAGIVYVLGGVTRPGGYLMQEDGSLNVVQALSLALGTTLQAKIQDIRIIRRNPNGSIAEIPVNYKGMMEGKSSPPILEATDIVYVPLSKVKTFFTSGAGVLGAATSATIYAVAR